METLEQFTIWAFSTLHFDVALNWACSHPVALVCQLDEVEKGVSGLFGQETPLLSSWLLSNLSNWNRGVWWVPWELPDLCGHGVVMWRGQKNRGIQMTEWFSFLHFVLLASRSQLIHSFAFWVVSCLYTRRVTAVFHFTLFSLLSVIVRKKEILLTKR